MIIEKNVTVGETTYGELSCGDPFFLMDGDGELFLATLTVDIGPSEGVNAVSLEDGSLFFFDNSTKIIPAKVKIVRA